MNEECNDLQKMITQALEERTEQVKAPQDQGKRIHSSGTRIKRKGLGIGSPERIYRAYR